eukprot:gene1642-2053_t
MPRHQRKPKGRPIDGWLIIDKPTGIGSTDVVNRVKRAYDAQKAGHGGTLDPLATGVLPLCFGAATKFSQLQLDADKVLVTVGRKPRTEGWGLENMGVAMSGPFVKIDDRCATSMKNVWAVGDLTGEPMLAHKGSAQGEVVAEIIAGHSRVFNPITIA